MMSPLQLEVFEDHDTRAGSSSITLDQSALEEAKLASYEQGYAAGWEDAAQAQSEDQARLRADVARNLQTLGFSFQEARVHVLRAIEPLLAGMVGQLLPATARASLGPLVLETLMPLVEGLAETPVTLVLNPASRVAVEGFLAKIADCQSRWSKSRRLAKVKFTSDWAPPRRASTLMLPSRPSAWRCRDFSL